MVVIIAMDEITYGEKVKKKIMTEFLLTAQTLQFRRERGNQEKYETGRNYQRIWKKSKPHVNQMNESQHGPRHRSRAEKERRMQTFLAVQSLPSFYCEVTVVG